MRIRHAAILTALAWFAVGCQNDLDLRYLDASVGGSLELPPDLIRYESESRFELPEVFSGDDESARDQVPVLAKVESLRLEGSRNLYWLSVEEPVDSLYQLVRNFWSAEGYRLTVDEPVIGIMQTEWIFREEGAVEGGGNWLERLFGDDDLSATQDQFKTRIERGEQGASRIYIAHRGTEYRHVVDSAARSRAIPGREVDDDNQWRHRLPDPELEVEMLSRLMIYLGLQKAEVEQQVTNVQLFEPRAYLQHDAEENSPFLLIKDAYQIAWNRVYHNLERMNVEIESADFESGILEQEGVFTVNIEIQEKKKGGLFSLGSGSQIKRRTIHLVLTQETHEFTRVEIEDNKGQIDTTPVGAEFLSLLYQQIK